MKREFENGKEEKRERERERGCGQVRRKRLGFPTFTIYIGT